METMHQFIESWSEALKRLDIDLRSISTKTLEIDTPLETLPLLENFGGENGMLILPDGVKVLQYHQILLKKGYGYSTINPPDLNAEDFQRGLILLLKDWTWTGLASEKPSWL